MGQGQLELNDCDELMDAVKNPTAFRVELEHSSSLAFEQQKPPPLRFSVGGGLG